MSRSKGAVVITGASTGIGAACALHLQQCGFLVFAGVRNIKDGERLVQQSEGNDIIPIYLDVTIRESIQSAADTVFETLNKDDTHPQLAGLINNAGIVIPGPMEFLPLDKLRHIFEINTFGALAVTQAFLEPLRTARGRVVMISSISGKITAPFTGAYNMSKFAMEAMSDALRMELSPWNVSVSLVEPGPIKTPLWKKVSHTSQEMLDGLPERGKELYGDLLTQMGAHLDELSTAGLPPEQVAELVEHILTCNSPKPRYPVGFRVKFFCLLKRLLPDRLMDRMVLKR